jgi:hypothetical protein
MQKVVFTATLFALLLITFEECSSQEQVRIRYAFSGDPSSAYKSGGYVFPNWVKIFYEEIEPLVVDESKLDYDRPSPVVGMTLKEFDPIFDALRDQQLSHYRRAGEIRILLRQSTNPEDAEHWRNEMNKFDATWGPEIEAQFVKSSLEKTLSAEKLERFKQIAIGHIFGEATFEEVLEGAEVLEGFKLSQSESARLQMEISKAQYEYELESRKLRQKMYKRVMASIPPDELEKLERYMMIDLKPQNEKKD